MYLYIVLYLCSKQKQLGEKMSVQISVRVSKEQKEKLVELAKNENKTITQYIVDRCIVEDSYTDTSNVDDASNRVAEVLHEQIEQIRADFETERSFYVSQIEQKDKQIAEMLETNNNQLQLIGALTIKNETLLLETKQSWWKRLFSSKKNK
jgi:predicted DNA-binding protein